MSTPVSRARKSARAGFRPSRSFDSSPWASALIPPPIRSAETCARPGAASCIWPDVSGARSKSSWETNRRARTRRRGSSSKLVGADRAQSAALEVVDAAERVDEAAVLEPAGHGVDREVTARHVLLEPDRRVADDGEVAVPGPRRPLRARRREVDTGGHERAHRAVARVQAHADELSVHLHVLDTAVGLEQRAEACLVDAGHEKVLVAVGNAEQLVADRATDDVGVDAERADVGADRGRHRRIVTRRAGGAARPVRRYV